MLSGQALTIEGQRIKAAESLLLAVKEIEELRGRIPKITDRAGFFQAGGYGGYLRAYQGLVATLAASTAKGEKLPPGFTP